MGGLLRVPDAGKFDAHYCRWDHGGNVLSRAVPTFRGPGLVVEEGREREMEENVGRSLCSIFYTYNKDEDGQLMTKV